MPGPAANPNARRRNDVAGWTTLPKVCETDVPEWPYSEPARHVAALWERLWRMPVATVWHEQDVALVVARYVNIVTAQAADPIEVSKEARQLEDRLLISPNKLRAARYLIGDVAPAHAGPSLPDGGVVIDLDLRRAAGAGLD